MGTSYREKCKRRATRQHFLKSKQTHRKPRDYLKGHLLEILETQEKKMCQRPKYQALKTSKVKESATMKRPRQSWSESRTTHVGKPPNHSRRPTSTQQRAVNKYPHWDLHQNDFKDHFAKNSWANEDSFHSITRRKPSPWDLLTQVWKQERKPQRSGAEQ